MRVTVYGTDHCSYCRRAEALLAGKGIPYRYLDVTDDPEARADLLDLAKGRRTVPVIVLDDEVIGGYRELVALGASGELDRRLAAAPPPSTKPADNPT